MFLDDSQCNLFLFLTGRPKRLFVFVNPFGGKKSASKIFVDHVKPLFDDADVHITLHGLDSLKKKLCSLIINFSKLLDCFSCFFEFFLPLIHLSETQYQLHAKEVASSLDLSKYDGIVCVSGDGILVEVGLLCLIATKMYYMF